MSTDFLRAAGETPALILSHDWSSTPLGRIESWPPALRIALRIVTTSRYAMWMAWGPDLTFFYNDAYAKMTLGAKHPWALGRPSREVWAEIWPQIGPRIDRVLTTGEATWDEGLLLFLERSGYREETYHTFSYSPLADDTGTIRGFLCVVTEETNRIIGERRLAILKELASQLTAAKKTPDVFSAVERCLATVVASDLPFTAIYLDDDGAPARLVGTTGIAKDHPAIATNALWQQAGIVELSKDFTWPTGPWNDPPTHALVVPLSDPAHDRTAGMFVAGLNPYLARDDAYQSFVNLFVGQVAAGLASAHAYEEERARAEALAELDRAKTVFFSNVSHEFRTPLTLMLGPLEEALAGTYGALADEHRAWIDLAHRNCLRLLKLVNTLLDFSRIESGRQDAVFERTDVARLTSDLASVFRAAAERAHLELVVDCPPMDAETYVDREMWEKIVLNLVSNALKFTFDGGITVSLRREAAAFVLRVKDTGEGIPPDEQPRVFERFHRVQGTRSRTHEGTGIGLALVSELVKLHGGSIAVKSTLGRGATFTVSIPIGRAHLPEGRMRAERTLTPTSIGAAPFVEEALRWLPERAGDRPSDGALDVWSPRGMPADLDGRTDVDGARIVLADDNADMRDYVTRLLTAHFEVDAAADGEEALALIKKERPELVLTDVMMPKLDGFGLLQAIRTDPALQNLPVILLSARAGEESRVEGMTAGADDYLVKPFFARELFARVRAHIQISRTRNELVNRIQESEKALRKSVEGERAAREQAEAANRMKDEFLATISHELRTPLNAILGWARMLRSNTLPEASVKNAIDTIERNARAQAQLIEDLLDVSRIVSGQLRLDVQPVDLVSAINAAIDSVRPAADAKGVRIQIVLDPLAGPIAGDPIRMQQVVWNLVANAIKFTPRGERVQVRLERVNSHIEIVVSDTGKGIDAAFLPFVFDRFRQADSTITRLAGGLGLGLAIVRHIVELHGGTAHAYSDGRDRGATFTIKLPLMPVHEAEHQQSERRRKHPTVSTTDAPIEYPTELVGVRVLVVEDEPDSRKLLTTILMDCRIEVRAVESASTARAALEEFTPDVILSDIEMPNEDGYAFMRGLRAHEPVGERIPAAALTAHVGASDRMRALSAGYDIHVPKPIDPAELLAVLMSLASRSKRARARP